MRHSRVSKSGKRTTCTRPRVLVAKQMQPTGACCDLAQIAAVRDNLACRLPRPLVLAPTACLATCFDRGPDSTSWPPDAAHARDVTQPVGLPLSYQQKQHYGLGIVLRLPEEDRCLVPYPFCRRLSPIARRPRGKAHQRDHTSCVLGRPAALGRLDGEAVGKYRHPERECSVLAPGCGY